jgi:Mrp family chromosome partitioning ATPase
MKQVLFEDALRIAIEAASQLRSSGGHDVRLVRDMVGRIRFVLNLHRDRIFPGDIASLVDATKVLGPYAASQAVLTRDDFADADAVFADPSWHATFTIAKGADGAVTSTVPVMDRQVTGQDWLRGHLPAGESRRAHRVVFHGLKGGVGRSTSLAMVAYGLARRSRRVLVVDFDLESPGLSSLLLPAERMASVGLVDWFVEDAVGQGDAIIDDMVSTSPLADTTIGEIRVAAAAGRDDAAYLDKLSRVYGDLPGPAGPRRCADRMLDIVEKLEASVRPDLILIDSRAGLHDLAAAAIVRLADTALLFSTGGAQSQVGYRQLFTHWQRRPDVAREVRERLAMVRALLPATQRERMVTAFRQDAYELFAETLYDELPACVMGEETDAPAGFHPSLQDEAAPHWPILVDWDERFQEFDPRVMVSGGGIGDTFVDATFGALIDWVDTRTRGAMT